MSIKNDQIALRERNINFLKQEINTLFKDAFKKLHSKYSLNIKQNVFDEDNTNEVREYLINEFEILNNEKCYFTNSKLSYIENIKIENKKFIYSIETILNHSSQVINEIYPPLHKKDGTSSNYAFLIRSINNTCGKVFLKHLIKSLKKENDLLPQLDFKLDNFEQPTYNHPIFKTAENEGLFKYCLNNRAKKINKLFVCYLYSYILHNLKGIRDESNIYDFVIFWNKNNFKPLIPTYPEKKTGFVSWDHQSNDYITEIEKLLKDF